jgi:hypothetical protein
MKIENTELAHRVNSVFLIVSFNHIIQTHIIK